MTDTEHTKESIGDTPVGFTGELDDFIVKYGEWSIRWGDLPLAAKVYLAQNGFSQSMTDAAALTKAQKHHPAPEGSPAGTLGEPLSDEELAAKVYELRSARFDRILAGTVAVRAGSPKAVSQLDRVMAQVATERLKAALATKGIALPSGKDKATGQPKTLTVSGKAMTREELVAAYVAKNQDDVKAEAERRIGESKAAVDTGELDDLLA